MARKRIASLFCRSRPAAQLQHSREADALQRLRQLAGALQLHGAPKIPRDSRTVRRPALSIQRQRLWRRHFAQPVNKLESRAHTEIVYWEYVRPPEVENEEHFDSPTPNPADFGEARDNLGVLQTCESFPIGHDPFEGFACKIPQRRYFRRRETNRAQLLLGRGQHRLRCWE